MDNPQIQAITELSPTLLTQPIDTGAGQAKVKALARHILPLVLAHFNRIGYRGIFLHLEAVSFAQ